ncbi:hypothetical protein Cni_G11862 [Canna indica]|uniref:Uncharacterized protein n=1 Tax=Canna indica TaxID=4628 RepID=A0AAQ3K6S9_9LILI|nr:hypothetical protein Cni_G11862 [Canna indica]
MVPTDRELDGSPPGSRILLGPSCSAKLQIVKLFKVIGTIIPSNDPSYETLEAAARSLQHMQHGPELFFNVDLDYAISETDNCPNACNIPMSLSSSVVLVAISMYPALGIIADLMAGSSISSTEPPGFWCESLSPWLGAKDDTSGSGTSKCVTEIFASPSMFEEAKEKKENSFFYYGLKQQRNQEIYVYPRFKIAKGSSGLRFAGPVCVPLGWVVVARDARWCLHECM